MTEKAVVDMLWPVGAIWIGPPDPPEFEGVQWQRQLSAEADPCLSIGAQVWRRVEEVSE